MGLGDTYVDAILFAACKDEVSSPAMVVPLLVTDDIETGQATNATNVARQLAANLGGVVNNIALQGGLADLRARFDALLGADYNSLYMVSRFTENGVEVRLGAARTPSSGYAMTTQTHNVTFLVLVPQDEKCAATDRNLRMVTYSRFRDAITGKALPGGDEAQSAQGEIVLQRLMGGVRSLPPSTVQELLMSMVKGDAEGFSDTVAKEGAGKSSFAPVWVALASVLEMSEFSFLRYDLPSRTPPPVHNQQAQTVIFSDSCRDMATVSIPGFGLRSPAKYMASLNLTAIRHDGKLLSLLATSVTQDAVGGPFLFQFPSLAFPRSASKPVAAACPDDAAAGPSARAQPAELADAVLVVKEIRDGRWGRNEGSGDELRFTSVYLAPSRVPSTASAIGIGVAADTVAASGSGTGVIRLLVKRPDDLEQVDISLSGAALQGDLAKGTLAKALPAGVTVSQGGLKILVRGDRSATVGKDGVIVIDLPVEGLVVGRAVVVSASGKQGGAGVRGSGAYVVVPVVKAEAPAK